MLQRIERAIGFHGFKGLVDRINEVAAQGEDKTKFVTRNRGSDQVKLIFAGTLIAQTDDLIDDEGVKVPGEQACTAKGKVSKAWMRSSEGISRRSHSWWC